MPDMIATSRSRSFGAGAFGSSDAGNGAPVERRKPVEQRVDLLRCGRGIDPPHARLEIVERNVVAREVLAERLDDALTDLLEWPGRKLAWIAHE